MANHPGRKKKWKCINVEQGVQLAGEWISKGEAISACSVSCLEVDSVNSQERIVFYWPREMWNEQVSPSINAEMRG